MDRHTARADVDRTLAAVGGGRVLCVGDDVDAIVAAFRERAVDADRCAMPANGEPFDAGIGATSADVVYVLHAFDTLDGNTRPAAIGWALAVARRAVVLRSTLGIREEIERQWLEAACRKHPMSQQYLPYEGLDCERGEVTLLFEPLPEPLGIGRTMADLAAERDLHMDMLREPGRRADAHVARYTFARQFIRPGDRVLDAACGLGYGTAILNDGTLAESVEGIDQSEWAIAYAREHYGCARARVSFGVSDVMAVAERAPASLDVIVSFETLEHIADPEGFLAACRRVLTPAGRLICSVPNEWTNADGVDPNPYHLQVFDRERLESLCRRQFLVEGVYGQTAGGGMKLAGSGRRIWSAAPDERQAEWWLLVGMTEPTGAARPMRHGLAGPGDGRLNVLAFDRDYENPWLVRAMVAIGLRTESHTLLSDLAASTLGGDVAITPDAGAALCVQSYRCLENGDPLPTDLRQRIRRYVGADTDVPHAFRWQVSLRYVQGLSALQQGHMQEAVRAFEACASLDALRFAPHLATKTVGAAFLCGWIALQAGRTAVARHWWKLGVDQAERALHRPWSELVVSREEPALFGLREAAAVVDLASQCATGLALSRHAAERPGLVASQLFECLRERAERAARGSGGAASPATDVEGARWSLLEHTDLAQLRLGAQEQVAAWALTLGGRYSSALLLHPPAILDVTVPTGDSGRLETAVAIHPDAWGRPNTSACAFSIRVDHAVATTIVIDPHRRETDRRWVELAVDVPATSTGTHELTFETKTLGARDFAWALFREPLFLSTEATRQKLDVRSLTAAHGT